MALESRTVRTGRVLPPARKSVAWGMLACAWLAVSALFPAPASTGQEADLPHRTREQARKAVAAVGLILVRPSEPDFPRPSGSGVIVSSAGYVATNFHVVGDTETGKPYRDLFFDLPASVPNTLPPVARYRLAPVEIDAKKDLALLRILPLRSEDRTPESGSYPWIPCGDSRTVQLLDNLIVIGFPEKGGSSVTVNVGVVEGKDIAGDWIKTDARILHGNSGGAAIDAEGRLIGIPTRVVLDGSPSKGNESAVLGGVGFLRPANLISAMLDRSTGATRRAANDGDAPVEKPSHRTGLLLSASQGRPPEGTVTDAKGLPVAGARIGIVPIGTRAVTGDSLLAWGGTNAEGRFELNRAIPPGTYLLKATALGFEPYSKEINITEKPLRLAITLKGSD